MVEPKQWVIRPKAGGQTAPFGAIFDGVRGIGFHARTLQFGTRLPVAQETFPRPTVAGGLKFLVRRRVGDASADRYLVLGGGQFLTLDVGAFDDLALFILEGTLVGYNVVAVLSPEDPAGRVDTHALLPIQYTAVGTYPVPPGAVSMMATATDAGFRWVGRDTVAGADIAVPLPAGWLSSEVLGDRFTTALGALGVLWRIGL